MAHQTAKDQYGQPKLQIEDKKKSKIIIRRIKDDLSRWKKDIPKQCSNLQKHLDELNQRCAEWQAELNGERHRPPPSHPGVQRATSSQTSHSGQRQQLVNEENVAESNFNNASNDSQAIKIDELKTLLEQERTKNTQIKEETQHMQDKLKASEQNYKIQSEKLIEMEQNIKKLKIAKDEALNRLSEIAGKKLLNNNPGIADLSTSIRPTKIAEMIKECYDNEWTDAFEECIDIGVPDKETILQLLNFFQVASRFCESQTEKFRKGLCEYVFDFPDKTEMLGHQNMVISKDASDVIKQLQKATCTHVYRRLQDRFVADCNQRSTKPLGRKLDTYVRKCVELTWYMCVQSPQMAIYCDLKEGELFDKEKFSMYTKTGDFVDYLVWPCIQLHTNGPLLTKGVAQARRHRTATPDITESGENEEIQRSPENQNTAENEQITLTQEEETDQETQSKMVKSVDQKNETQNSENSNSDVQNLSNVPQKKTVIQVVNLTNRSTDKNKTNIEITQTKL